MSEQTYPDLKVYAWDDERIRDDYAQRIADLEAEVARLRAEPKLDEMLQDLRRRYGSYVHLSTNYNNRWWVAWGAYPQNRTGYYPAPSDAIRAAWEQVCKGGDA